MKKARTREATVVAPCSPEELEQILQKHSLKKPLTFEEQNIVSIYKRDRVGQILEEMSQNSLAGPVPSIAYGRSILFHLPIAVDDQVSSIVTSRRVPMIRGNTLEEQDFAIEIHTKTGEVAQANRYLRYTRQKRLQQAQAAGASRGGVCRDLVVEALQSLSNNTPGGTGGSSVAASLSKKYRGRAISIQLPAEADDQLDRIIAERLSQHPRASQPLLVSQESLNAAYRISCQKGIAQANQYLAEVSQAPAVATTRAGVCVELITQVLRLSSHSALHAASGVQPTQQLKK